MREKKIRQFTNQEVAEALNLWLTSKPEVLAPVKAVRSCLDYGYLVEESPQEQPQEAK